ncbi:single-stranded DNA-binding protein [Algoriphagus sp. Y33]|uniref:single-stranded DNA-binding protein n=1 Tax=Algoriphagus sp. Y33 TaxID=2772483 RepID=UPI001785D707|nr:single-stranded DNA-binding protein [Algoriphagus sp. Y33]
MVITGRLTADANVAELKDDRKVVNFSIAINDRYKTKAGEQKEVTNYVSCAYWLNTTVVQWLKKGALVELYGRIGVDAYVNTDGNAVGRLNFHTNNIKLLATPRRNGGAVEETEVVTQGSNGNGDEKDDLPF